MTPMTPVTDIRTAGTALFKAREQYAVSRRLAERAWDELRKAALAAISAGMSESEAARVAGVDRMTVRKWLGKR